MKSLGSLLRKRNIQPKTISNKDVFFVFSQVIKEEFGNIGSLKLKADFFKNKTLFIKSKSSAWGSELFTNREDIIHKMNERLGEDIIKEIKLK